MALYSENAADLLGSITLLLVADVTATFLSPDFLLFYYPIELALFILNPRRPLSVSAYVVFTGSLSFAIDWLAAELVACPVNDEFVGSPDILLTAPTRSIWARRSREIYLLFYGCGSGYLVA